MRQHDPLSQRSLLRQMKAVIDLILHDERPRVREYARRRLIALAWENPTATRSTYVQYNLGKARREVLDAMAQDSKIAMQELRVDGGMVSNELLMQFQADILDVPVIRPKVAETTALGAAYAAGLAVGYWASQDEIKKNWALDKRIEPRMPASERERLYRSWQKAVRRSLDWVTTE